MVVRREFLTGMAAGALGARGLGPDGVAAALTRPPHDVTPHRQEVRDLFPRLEQDVYLNGAGGAPLGRFARAAMDRMIDFHALGPEQNRAAYFQEVFDAVRGRFAELIGADPAEVGWVECTKRGEQLVLESLDLVRRGKNVVTNDLHFSGSLHNLEGLRRLGLDVRVVPVDSDFHVSLDRMVDAMDGDTALVTVSLVSNVNGDVAPVRQLADEAHERGALLFADVIQAAGCIPFDVHALEIDVAACSSYKWLHGVHGAGFVYVRRGLQGEALPDRMVPGTVSRNYLPWRAPDPAEERLRIAPRDDARRYQPGHVSYLGYAAAYEGMAFLAGQGGPTAMQAHGARLIEGFLSGLDTDRYRVLTPEPGRTPILALRAASLEGMIERLVEARVIVSLGGDADGLIRISPGLYSTTEDMAVLLEVLDG